MLDKLNIIKQRFDEISDLIIQPDVISDQNATYNSIKEYKELRELMEKREVYVSLAEFHQRSRRNYCRWQWCRNGGNGQNGIGNRTGAPTALEEKSNIYWFPKTQKMKNAVMEIAQELEGRSQYFCWGPLPYVHQILRK